MKKIILCVLISMAMALSGCSSCSDTPAPECTDHDGDGYGEGQDCLGWDCDDTDEYCWEGDCCNGGCTDEDGDGYGTGTCTGPDCDDDDENNWTSCATCLDEDGDTWFAGCDAYTSINGPDCDDADQNNWISCAACLDEDGDDWYVGCDAYTSIDGPDCDDTDVNCYAGACCLVCTDNDGDGYGAGPGCAGPDCDDADQNNWTSCATCDDADNDGYHGGCDAYVTITGPDCDDGDENNWASCATCADADGDGYYGGCDAYVSIVGPDCDDADENNWVSCASCRDNDNDGWYGGGCDAYISINGPDCNESDPACWEGDCCLDCTDMDGDGYGTGPDCTGADCDDNDANNWVSCATCDDIDGDGSFVGCDAYVTILGPDCDDNDANNWVSCATCDDADGDNWFVDCDDYVTIDGPDCDDSDVNNWVSCATCADGDSDTYYGGCDAYVTILGPDCDDSDVTSYLGAAEVCDGNDNDCLGGIPVTETDDDTDGYVECAGWNDTQGDDPGITGGSDCDDLDVNNWTSCASCDDADSDGYHAGCDAYVTIDGPDCDDGDPASYPGAAEACDGNDNDCAGGIPADEIDDDGDGYVECDPFVDTQGDDPGISGGDCDDTEVTVNPGAAEDCLDGLDNNCDGLTDLEDVVACPPIEVIINKWGPEPRPVSHGRTTWISADIIPQDPNAAAPWAWPRVWETIDARPAAACDVGDVFIHDQSDWRAGSQIQADLPDLLAKKDCVYTIQVTVNGYATDVIDVQMINQIPEITAVSNAIFDGTAWRLQVAAGTPLSITATAWDMDNDTPLNFDWTGPDVGVLSCAATTCQSTDGTSPYQTTVAWDSATSPGTYNLTVEVWDDFEPSNPTSVDVVVEVDACVWVVQGGSGTGTLASPLGSIATALNQARNSADTNVCVIGTGTFTEDLTLPSNPNIPDLLGGFDASGNLSTDRPTIVSSIAPGLRFQAGHTGRIHHFTIQQSVSGGHTVTVLNASPEISDCIISLADGVGPVGVHIEASGLASGAMTPTIRAGQINMSSVGPAQDATGIYVMEAVGSNAAPRIANGHSLNMWGCSGTCRGVHLTPGTFAEIRNNQGFRVDSNDGIAYAIDLEGTAARPVGAVIDGNDWIGAGTGGTRAVAVNLWRTQRVSITNNRQVGAPWDQAGRELSAGIADGYVLRNGTTAAGESDLLTVSGNTMIAGGASWWAQPCTNPGDTGEGSDVAVGILLVGSSDVTISDNGRPHDWMAGIFGGGSTIHWVPIRRRLPPSAVGIWLIDTDNVSIVSNEVRSGGYRDFTSQGCPSPDIAADPTPELPPATAFRDGLPPNDDYLMGPAPGSLPSRNTVFDKNGASCAAPPENGGMGAGVVTWCAAVELNVPSGATAPVLTNNHLAATKGNFLIALWQRGGSGVLAVNNTMDADQMLMFDPPPPPNTLRKWPVFAENIAPDGLTLVNNIIYSHVDDPYDIVAERLCLNEWVASGTSSNIDVLSSNLFYIEGDDLTDPSAPPYIRVTDHATTTTYAPAGLNVVAGIPTCAGNFADLPGLTEPTQDYQKSTARLVSGSAAIDAGLSSGVVPPDDIDLEPRPDSAGGAIDIGHDEFY